MSTFSKVLHVGEETISVTGNNDAVSLAMSRQSVRLSHEEADELVEALTHGRTRSDGFTAADMMDARAEGFRDGRKAAEAEQDAVIAECIGMVKYDDVYGRTISWLVEGGLSAIEPGDYLYCLSITAPKDGSITLYTPRHGEGEVA